MDIQDGGGVAPDNATNKPGEFFVFGWSLYRDTLTVTPVKDQTSPMNFRSKRGAGSAQPPHGGRYLDTRCPPPAAAPAQLTGWRSWRVVARPAGAG